MKKFIIIGLGNFGFNIALTLVENNCEVLGMDSNRDAVQHARDFISHAIIGDASNKEVLESLALRDFDGAIISIGHDMGASILISLYIKEIGIPRIIVRAISEDHGKILRMIGVTDVIFPEKDMAVRVANKLALKNAMDYLPLTDDYGIIEVTPPKSFVGKTLKELQISTRYGCQIIGLKYPPPEGASPGIEDKNHKIKIAPTAHDTISADVIMIVIGKHADIDRLQGVR
ncbi:MAG TPA: TrkA family potassium uptake protein [Spirochaetota bacterium]|nr:TrkA family potassium uptake protein [Spirochaetota bacterium]